MRFLFGGGMISDDTEHALMVAQALLAEPRHAAQFQKALGWKLRWWFASLPAGVGLATAKACLRLWLGFPAKRAGVASGGAGPAMRSAIIGAFFADDAERRREFVTASTNLTHRGWQAEAAAAAVAELTALRVQSSGHPEHGEAFRILRAVSAELEWLSILGQIEASLSARHSVSEFARHSGLEGGVTGYALHVTPIAIFAWLRHPSDFRRAMIEVLDLGGDTDTTGAILGALAGCDVGETGIPREWTGSFREWPRTPAFMRDVAAKLAAQHDSEKPLGPVEYCWPALPVRNFIFLITVLAHGFRRLAPPY